MPLTSASQRGFTLIELLVAIVMFTLVGGAIYKTLVNNQRMSRTQSERVNLQSNVRTGALVVPSELREIGVNGTASDIVALGSSDITYRAMRAIGFICQVTSSTELRILQSSFSGYRDIAPVRDRLYVFVDTNVDLNGDDKWIEVGITGVDAASTCGAQPAIRLTTSTMTGGALAALLADITVGSPVRTYEAMRLQLYVDGTDGKSWLGAQSVNTPGSVNQPVLGPLLAGSGFQLKYYTDANAQTADPLQVRRIEVAIRGVTSEKVHAGGGGGPPATLLDTLITQVALRNAPHR